LQTDTRPVCPNDQGQTAQPRVANGPGDLPCAKGESGPEPSDEEVAMLGAAEASLCEGTRPPRRPQLQPYQ